jgi:signal transduction histidine kinase
MGTAGPSGTAASIDAAAVQRDRLESLGRLTAGIAHELNNPIGYISSNIHTLERYAGLITTLVNGVEDLLPESQREEWRNRLAAARWDYLRTDLPALLSETRQGTEQLKHVVAELKSLCRHNASAEPVTVDACVHAALLVLTHALKRRVRVCLDLAAPDHLPLVRAQVVQLIINLVHNAVEAFGDRPPGNNAIRITTRVLADAVELTVEDNGPGVPVEDRQRIFEPFHTTKAQGTGQGLAIIERIVHHHGGTIVCDSSAELGGARFVAILRAWQVQDHP